MSAHQEAKLASALSDELALLHTLESYRIGSAPYPTAAVIDEVKVSWRTPWVSNDKNAIGDMQNAVSEIVCTHMPELIETAVANQRTKVSDARQRLLDFQFAKTVNGAADAAAQAADGVTGADVARLEGDGVQLANGADHDPSSDGQGHSIPNDEHAL